MIIQLSGSIPSQEECNAMAIELLKSSGRVSTLCRAIDERLEGIIGCSLAEHRQVEDILHRKHVAIAAALWIPVLH